MEHINTKNEAYNNTLNACKIENEEIKIQKIDFNLSKLIKPIHVSLQHIGEADPQPVEI